MKKIYCHKELTVYINAMDSAMEIFKLSKNFGIEERYSLTDQIRRSSRSVCANIAEAWSKSRYKTAFIAKLSDAEGEASETRVWLEFAFRCNYISRIDYLRIETSYTTIIGQIISMITSSDKWLIP